MATIIQPFSFNSSQSSIINASTIYQGLQAFGDPTLITPLPNPNISNQTVLPTVEIGGTLMGTDFIFGQSGTTNILSDNTGTYIYTDLDVTGNIINTGLTNLINTKSNTTDLTILNSNFNSTLTSYLTQSSASNIYVNQLDVANTFTSVINNIAILNSNLNNDVININNTFGSIVSDTNSTFGSIVASNAITFSSVINNFNNSIALLATNVGNTLTSYLNSSSASSIYSTITALNNCITADQVADYTQASQLFLPKTDATNIYSTITTSNNFNTTISNYLLTNNFNATINNYLLTNNFSNTITSYLLVNSFSNTINSYFQINDFNNTSNTSLLMNNFNNAISSYLQISKSIN